MREPGGANKQKFVKTLAIRLLGESNSSAASILCKKCGKPGHLPAVFRSSGKIVEAANACMDSRVCAERVQQWRCENPGHGCNR